MTDIETLLAGLPARRVLDVATGRGNFMGTLKATLRGVEEIISIDILNCETRCQADYLDLSEDPKDPEVLRFLDDIMEQCLTLAR